MQKCAMCKGEVPEDAKKCMHCGSKLNIARIELRKAVAGSSNITRNILGVVGVLFSIAMCFVFLPVGIILLIAVIASLIGLKQKIACPKCSESVKVDNMLSKAYCFKCQTDIHIDWQT